jgi:hypothetical protein
VDRVRADTGDDEVRLEDDDARDSVSCGPGDDLVVWFGPRDPLDVLSGCERLRVLEE